MQMANKGETQSTIIKKDILFKILSIVARENLDLPELDR